MNEPSTPCPFADHVALYVAGAMSNEEIAAFERHLDEGCPSCRSEVRGFGGVADRLMFSLPTVPIEPRLRGALMARVDSESDVRQPSPKPVPQIWRQWADDTSDGHVVIPRAADGGWEQTGVEGVEIRRLFVDRQRNQMTALIRMAPGAAYPAHVHAGPEECWVLSGDLRAGAQVLQPGDYERIASGVRHGVQITENGCLLLIVSSLSDELE